MIKNKYVSMCGSAALLVAGLQASLVSAAVCTPNVPTSFSGVNCPSSTANPRANGRGEILSSGTIVRYRLNLVSGLSSSAFPVKVDGFSQVPKQGGGFCPSISDQTPGAGLAPETQCNMAVVNSAKKLRISVG